MLGNSHPPSPQFVFMRFFCDPSPAYGQIYCASVVFTRGFEWPDAPDNAIELRARRQSFQAPSLSALLRVPGGDPFDLEHGVRHDELVRRLNERLQRSQPCIYVGYGLPELEVLRQVSYRSLCNPYVADAQNCGYADMRLIAATISMVEPDAIRWPGAPSCDEIACFASLLNANALLAVDERDLCEPQAFVAATIALADHLQKRAPSAFAMALACAYPECVKAVVDRGLFLHAAIRGGRPRIRALMTISSRATTAAVRYCIDISEFLEQSDADLEAGRRPERFSLIKLTPNAHEIAIPLSGSPFSDRFRRLVEVGESGDPPPSVARLETCARRLRSSGRLLRALRDLVAQREAAPLAPDAPVDECLQSGPPIEGRDLEFCRRVLAAPVADKQRLARLIAHPGLRAMARRHIWEAATFLLPPDEFVEYAIFKRARLLGPIDSRWRTLARVRDDLSQLEASAAPDQVDQLARIAAYLDAVEASVRA